jgi:hypothetical protein
MVVIAKCQKCIILESYRECAYGILYWTILQFVHELSSAQIWQHKLGATLSASVNINYRLPIEVYYRICTLRHIRIEINHGNQNVFWVLTSGLVDISKRYPPTHVKTQSNFLASMNACGQCRTQFMLPNLSRRQFMNMHIYNGQFSHMQRRMC